MGFGIVLWMSQGEEEGWLRSRSGIDGEGTALGGWRLVGSLHGEEKKFASVADSKVSMQRGAEHGLGALVNMCVKYSSTVFLDWNPSFREWGKA